MTKLVAVVGMTVTSYLNKIENTPPIITGSPSIKVSIHGSKVYLDKTLVTIVGIVEGSYIQGPPVVVPIDSTSDNNSYGEIILREDDETKPTTVMLTNSITGDSKPVLVTVKITNANQTKVESI